MDIRSSVSEFAESLPRGSKVLDVGCGRRPYEALFAHCDYVGVDVETSGRSSDDKHAHVYFNGVDLPFDDAKLDGILCTEVLEHAIEPLLLVREIGRVLKPGGRILITVPFMWGEHEAPYDFRRFSTFGLRRLLDDVGLEIISTGKLTTGVDAINALVQSEIVNFESNVDTADRSAASRLLRRLAKTVTQRTWMLQLRMWRRLYRFERIYIDNVVIATRRDATAS